LAGVALSFENSRCRSSSHCSASAFASAFPHFSIEYVVCLAFRGPVRTQASQTVETPTRRLTSTFLT